MEMTYKHAPYYKKNGFYDRLERFSRWIDYKFYQIDQYGILYYVPGFRKIAMVNTWIKECEIELDHFRRMYNRDKYFWMAKK